jgi:DNA-binding Lrp family transcriptional regulator
MDPIDEKIINLLRDGRPREFEQLLRETGCSHNTMRLHLDSLAEKSLITKNKRPVKERGRPKFMYSTPPGSIKASGVRLNQSTGVVSPSFSRLSQICRFEKGGYCKRIRGSCYAQDCPQIR